MFVCVCVCVFTRYHSSNLAIAASRSLSSLQNANRAKFAARCCAWQRSQPSNTGLAHRKHAGRAMQCSAAHLVLRAVERRGWYRHDAFLVDGIPAKCPVPRHGRAGRCGHGEILGRDVHLQLAPAQPCTHTATQSQRRQVPCWCLPTRRTCLGGRLAASLLFAAQPKAYRAWTGRWPSTTHSSCSTSAGRITTCTG